MSFEEYLTSKRIDSTAFNRFEPTLWQSWKGEFENMHPTSFTAQKLYLINPIRRKYHLKVEEKAVPAPVKESVALTPSSADNQTIIAKPVESTEPKNPSAAKPAVPRPVFKPKPKTN